MLFGKVFYFFSPFATINISRLNQDVLYLITTSFLHFHAKTLLCFGSFCFGLAFFQLFTHLYYPCILLISAFASG